LSVGFYEGFFGPGAGSFFLIGIHLLLKAGLVKASGTAKSFNIAANLGAVTTFLPQERFITRWLSPARLPASWATA